MTTNEPKAACIEAVKKLSPSRPYWLPCEATRGSTVHEKRGNVCAPRDGSTSPLWSAQTVERLRRRADGDARAGNEGRLQRRLQRRARRQLPRGSCDPHLHGFAVRQRYLHGAARDADGHRPASPAHAERQAAPLGRQLRVDSERVAHQVEAGEADYDRLPERAQPGNTHTTGAVGVEVKVEGSGLAQEVQCHLWVAQACRDQRVKPRAERTAVS